MPSRTIRILDLFAGAGGLTAGFHEASDRFRSVVAVELDPAAPAPPPPPPRAAGGGGGGGGPPPPRGGGASSVSWYSSGPPKGRRPGRTCRRSSRTPARIRPRRPPNKAP